MTKFSFKYLDEEMSYFCGKTIPGHETFDFHDLVVYTSEGFEQILEGRKNREFTQETLRLKGSKLEKLMYWTV